MNFLIGQVLGSVDHGIGEDVTEASSVVGA